MRQTSKATVAKARALRRAMSPAEVRLWQVLRARPAGLKFRHQHPAGPFVLDFYCPAARLVIEIDGLIWRWELPPKPLSHFGEREGPARPSRVGG